MRKAVHDLREETDEIGIVKKTRALNLLARNLVTLAIGGDMSAMREIGDRLDGKAHQSIEHSGEVASYVARAPQPSKTADDWAEQHAVH